MFCTKCGMKIEDGSTFCVYCGATIEQNMTTPVSPAPVMNTRPPEQPTAIPQPQPAPSPQPVPLQKAAPSPQPVPQQKAASSPQPVPQQKPASSPQVLQTAPQKKSYAWLIILIIGLVVAALVIGGILIYKFVRKIELASQMAQMTQSNTAFGDDLPDNIDDEFSEWFDDNDKDYPNVPDITSPDVTAQDIMDFLNNASPEDVDAWLSGMSPEDMDALLNGMLGDAFSDYPDFTDQTGNTEVNITQLSADTRKKLSLLQNDYNKINWVEEFIIDDEHPDIVISIAPIQEGEYTNLVVGVTNLSNVTIDFDADVTPVYGGKDVGSGFAFCNGLGIGDTGISRVFVDEANISTYDLKWENVKIYESSLKAGSWESSWSIKDTVSSVEMEIEYKMTNTIDYPESMGGICFIVLDDKGNIVATTDDYQGTVEAGETIERTCPLYILPDDKKKVGDLAMFCSPSYYEEY